MTNALSKKDRVALRFALSTAIEHERTALDQLNRLPEAKQTVEIRAAIQERVALMKQYDSLRRVLIGPANSNSTAPNPGGR